MTLEKNDLFGQPDKRPAAPPSAMCRIYGKYKGQHKFKAMDLREGVQVRNMIFATLLSREEADKFMAVDAKLNEDWQFQIRSVAP